MTVCPHCHTDSTTVATQARMITELQEDKRELLELLTDAGMKPPLPGLSPNEARIFMALLRNERMSRQAIMAITQSRAEDSKIVDVWICKLRKKIKPLGLEIKNIWGEGYFIPREQREATRAKLVA
jgi:two-component system cell cycle response regulator CtrA